MKSLTLLRALILTTGLSIAGAAPAQNVSTEDLRKQLDAPWKAKDWPAAETIARQITAQPGSTAPDWRNLVNVLRNQKKIDDAHLARQELVKRAGANSSDHNGICWYLLARNKALEARPSCQKAVDLDSTDFAALVNLGHTYLLSGDKTQAMAWYRKTLPQINKEEELKDGPLDD